MKLNLFGKSNTRPVELCERCGDVCDSVCRAEAARETARLQMLYGWRAV